MPTPQPKIEIDLKRQSHDGLGDNLKVNLEHNLKHNLKINLKDNLKMCLKTSRNAHTCPYLSHILLLGLPHILTFSRPL